MSIFIKTVLASLVGIIVSSASRVGCSSMQ